MGCSWGLTTLYEGNLSTILNYQEEVLETEQANSFWNLNSTLIPYKSDRVIWDNDWKVDGVFKDI